ncbi:site-2 protease family protein [Hymenobacter arizonensis]|uniref:Peptidase family M50 n=1 Tax=Hymenobacter arizonensis TaxID=1227077 RepID=A0A1I5T7X5_HYMAR|nr:site-2 protease family protein [Hymenobacter arizonensis]SFP79123.1 Peptidase family M50 [Hymenobacter arizonensis]
MRSILWNGLLVFLSYYANNLVHEMGHLVTGRLFGLPMHKVFIALSPARSQPAQPTFSLFGVAFYIGISSLVSFAPVNEYRLKRATPRARFCMNLAGPLCGALFAIGWILFFWNWTQGIIGALWVLIHLENLQPKSPEQGGPNDGYGVAEAWREIKVAKANP